jgi:Omp85 superfamily domain
MIKRCFAIVVLILGAVMALAPAHASSSPAKTSSSVNIFDPSTWPQPNFYPSTWEWPKKFSLTDPNTWPFIPVPEIATDPNAGTTAGVLPVVLFTDEHHNITSIFAPDIETNTTMGPGSTLRYLAYPSENTQWYAIGGLQEKIARKVDLDFQTGRERKTRWSFEGRFYFERDPTERFYGVGNSSTFADESNYTTEQVYGYGMLGFNFDRDLQLALTMRPRYLRFFNGAFTNVPQVFTEFPNQKGLDGGSEFPLMAILTYDTRDSLEIPRKGGLALVYAAIADRRLMSSISYTRFGGELRHYYTVCKNLTLAGHMFLEYEPTGNELPFWAMARLGGEESLLTDQQTLRGYGAGRYVDNNLAVANVEARTRVYEHDIFGTRGILELAPFLDIGRVAHSMDYDPLSSMHPVGGIGFRGVAEPFVVGYVDVGYGGEGTAVFSGVNYPF